MHRAFCLFLTIVFIGLLSTGCGSEYDTDETGDAGADADTDADADVDTDADTDADTDTDTDIDTDTDTDTDSDTDADTDMNSCSGVITFPDANLEAVIRAKINKPTGDIVYGDVAGGDVFER